MTTRSALQRGPEKGHYHDTLGVDLSGVTLRMLTFPISFDADGLSGTVDGVVLDELGEVLILHAYIDYADEWGGGDGNSVDVFLGPSGGSDVSFASANVTAGPESAVPGKYRVLRSMFNGSTRIVRWDGGPLYLSAVIANDGVLVSGEATVFVYIAVASES